MEKRNLSALLVGMQTGAATVESSMELTQKIKNKCAYLKNVKGIIKSNLLTNFWPVVAAEVKTFPQSLVNHIIE